MCQKCEICCGEIDDNGFCIACGLPAGDYLPDDIDEDDIDEDEDDKLLRPFIN